MSIIYSLKRLQEIRSIDLEHVALGIFIFSSISIFANVLLLSRYGFDFTDEAFYLVWIANPSAYNWSLTQFGFVYHPLYLLLDGDVGLLRQANIVITVFLALILVNMVLKDIVSKELISPVKRLVITVSLAPASLAYLHTWLPTPSYNSLAFQGTLIAIIGVLLIREYNSNKSLSGWLLLSVGGWLCFMAKPSTAAALFFCATLYLSLLNRIYMFHAIIAAVFVLFLLFLSAILIDGSVLAFVERLTIGVEYSELLDAGYSIQSLIRIDFFSFTAIEKVLFILLVFVAFFGGRLFLSKPGYKKTYSLYMSLSALCIVFSVMFGGFGIGMWFGPYRGVIILVVMVSAFSLIYATYGRSWSSTATRSQWLLFFCFASLPHVYAFGSNGNYWQVGSSAGIYWLLAGLVLVSVVVQNQRKPMVFIPYIMVAQIIVTLDLQTGLEHPYRQPQALHLNSYAIDVGKPGAQLFLSEEYGVYLSRSTSVAVSAGFHPGGQMIDLSGQSPGVLYALQAKSLGLAWMIGGYPGSLDLAAAALRRVPCEEFASAWVLDEPTGPRKISGDLLKKFGANLSKDYDYAGSWYTASGASGYSEVQLQALYKPNRSEIQSINACISATSVKK